MTFSLDKDLAEAVRVRSRGLRISVSGYLRMLADQDIGGGQILVSGPHRGVPVTAPAGKPLGGSAAVAVSLPGAPARTRGGVAA